MREAGRGLNGVVRAGLRKKDRCEWTHERGGRKAREGLRRARRAGSRRTCPKGGQGRLKSHRPHIPPDGI